MTRIDRYLIANHLLGMVPILFLLLGLFGFVNLAEELESVGEGYFEDVDALRVSILTLPRIAIDLLPVAALLGGVIALGRLAAGEELTAMRASGVSIFRLAKPLVITAFLLTVLTMASQQFVVPVLEQQATDIRSKKLEETLYVGEAKEFWTRGDDIFIRIGEMRLRSIPSDIEIYEMTDDGRISRIVLAEFADIIDANKWTLNNVQEIELLQPGSREVHYQTKEWVSFLDKIEMESLVAPVETLSLTELKSYVDYLNIADLRVHAYEFRLWQHLSIPLALLAMCLLALPFVIGSLRTRAAGTRVLFGMIVGIGFYLAEQMSSQLTLLYELPTVLMAILPDGLLLIMSLVFLAKAR